MAASELKIAGVKLMIEGGAQFQSDLNTAKQSSKLLSTELKLLEAGTTSAGKNGVEFLRAKSEALSAQLAKQEQVTKINKIALQEAASAAEVDAKQVQRLEDEVVKSQIAEEKLKVALLGVTEQMNKATNVAMQHGLAQKEMGEKAQATGKKITSAGDTMTKYLTAPAIAATAALSALIVKTVGTADGIKKMSEVTGLSTDRVQELTYAGKDLDVELEVITKSMAKNIKSMKGAQDGTTLTVAAYKKLGVEYKNVDGSLRDSETVYWEVVESLGNMTNETERDGIAMQLLGKSAQELNPLIKAGSTRLAELSAEAHKNGAVMSGESVDALDAFGDSVEKAKVSIGTAAGEIAVKMMPALNKLLPIVEDDIIPAIGDFADKIGDLVEGYDKLDPVTQTVIKSIGAMVLVSGPAISLIGKGIGLFGTLTAMQGAYTVAKAAHTAATTAQTAAVVAETGAVNSLAVAESAATVAGTGLAAALGPIALIAAATGIIIAGSKYIIESNMFKIAGGDMDACALSAERLASSQTVLDGTTTNLMTKIEEYKISFDSLSESLETSAVDVNTYADSLQSAEDKMSEWDGGITAAQERLSGLAEQVAEEGREYTEAEKAEITALIDTIDDYTQKKAELFETHLQTLNAIALSEKNMSEENMLAYTQQAKDGYTELRKIADEAYADSVAATVEKYGAEGQLNKAAFDNEILLAQEARDKKIEAAQESANEVIETTSEAYAAQHVSGTDYIEKLTKLKNDEKAIKLERNKAIVDANTELQKTEAYQNANAITQWQMICEEEAKINADYDQKIIEADAALAQAQNDTAADQAAALVALVQSMADSGIKIDKNTLDAVNAYLESMGLAKIDAETMATDVADSITTAFDGKPEDMYDVGADIINGLIKGMNSKTEGVTAQTEVAAATIEKVYRKKLDTHSPSTVMQKAAEDTWDGVIVGTKNKMPELARSSEASAKTMVDGFSAKPLISLGGLSASRAMSERSSATSVVHNSTVDESIVLSMAGAVFNVRQESDINRIAEALARMVASKRKAVGSP